MERKKAYVEVLSKVVTNTVGTNSNLKNTDKKQKIIEANVSKSNCSLCGNNKIEGGKNIHFAIESKMSDGRKNEFTVERDQIVESNAFLSQHINGLCESNCNFKCKVR